MSEAKRGEFTAMSESEAKRWFGRLIGEVRQFREPWEGGGIMSCLTQPVGEGDQIRGKDCATTGVMSFEIGHPATGLHRIFTWCREEKGGDYISFDVSDLPQSGKQLEGSISRTGELNAKCTNASGEEQFSIKVNIPPGKLQG